VAATLLAAPANPAHAEDPLIPLETLLGPPRIVAPRLSPDGTRVSWIAPLEGAPNLWVAPVESIAAARPVTRERGRGLQAFDVSGNVMYRWTADSRRIVFPKDRDGDENWNWYVLDPGTGRVFNATPRESSQVRLIALGEADPRAALVGINDRDPRRHDLYRLDLDTGSLRRVERNERFVAMIADRALRPRVAVEVTPAGELDVLRSGGDGVWRPLDHIGRGDAPGKSIGFDAANRILYAMSTHGRNTAALVAWDLGRGTMKTLATDERVDVGRVLVHPLTGVPQAISTNYTRLEWRALDPALRPDLAVLARPSQGGFDVVDRSRDDRRWLVQATRDDGPETWFLYERPARTLRRLFVSHPSLEGLPLARLHPVVIRSRDGLALVSYVCLPRGSDPDGDGVPTAPLPTVMLVHGGPGDERAEYGFAPFVQWLANRGYAVLNVNFRGSPGFGKAFLNAERLEWGGRMNLDLVDQAEWAVARGIADRRRIAIMGGSYGGYATLCAMTLTPGIFACAIDVVGPANLETFIATMPKTWSLDHLARRIGDPRTPEGLAHLRARSPIHFVDRVREPMLVAQGARDARVAQAESDSMVGALDRRGVRVTYLLYPDEGHGFLRPGNSAAFYAVTEAFLAANLGGRCEPLSDQLDDSSVLVPVGAGRVPGLSGALAHRDAARR
jgi:dipeptidyl aminopeptidase/acylaminoacyl peptidase